MERNAGLLNEKIPGSHFLCSRTGASIFRRLQGSTLMSRVSHQSKLPRPCRVTIIPHLYLTPIKVPPWVRVSSPQVETVQLETVLELFHRFLLLCRPVLIVHVPFSKHLSRPTRTTAPCARVPLSGASSNCLRVAGASNCYRSFVVRVARSVLTHNSQHQHDNRHANDLGLVQSLRSCLTTSSFACALLLHLVAAAGAS